MPTAAEIMTREVFTLTTSMSLGGAAWALMHRGVSGAPVRDDEGNLVGVISEAELLEARAGVLGAEADFTDDERQVLEVMTPALLAVGPDAPVSEVVELMVLHGAHRVLVLDDAGALAGIVSTVDVLRELAEGRLGPSRERAEWAGWTAPAP